MRIDRVFFTVAHPFKSFTEMNTAGKLVGIYVVAVAAALVFRAVKGVSVKWQGLLIPAVFVAYITEKLKNCLKKKSEFIWYSVGVSMIILSAVNFEPYDDSVTYFERNRAEAGVEACIPEIKDGLVWAPVEFVSVARRLDGSIETLFGRDVNNPLMAGISYENDGEMGWEYRNAIYNVALNKYAYVTRYDTDYIVQAAREAGVKYVVLPSEAGYTVKRMEELE